MAKKKFRLEFEGMEELIDRLESLNGDLKSTTESALKATFGEVTPGVSNAMNSSPYDFNHTGRTRGSLVKTPQVEWEGTLAAVPVGYDISGGGLASIFLMYGTPTIAPDRNLYNAFYGTKIRKQVAEVQREVFQKRIERLGK